MRCKHDISVNGHRDYALRTGIFPGDPLTVYMRKT